MLRQCATVVLATFAAACAGPLTPTPDAAERYGQHCERLGHARGSEGFRACVETEDINAQLAVQREYDRKLMRRMDCVDPRIACDSPR
jgi:hypothetical protein